MKQTQSLKDGFALRAVKLPHALLLRSHHRQFVLHKTLTTQEQRDRFAYIKLYLNCVYSCTAYTKLVYISYKLQLAFRNSLHECARHSNLLLETFKSIYILQTSAQTMNNAI